MATISWVVSGAVKVLTVNSGRRNRPSPKRINCINETNQTDIYFIITGISEAPELQALIFLLVLFIYLFILGGNMTIVVLVCLDPQLHTPMYFFLCNLSTLDIFSSTVTLHKILISFLTGDNTLSLYACMSQMFIFISLVCNELMLLSAMSYDRFVAVCKPLHYYTVMSPCLCSSLASACWASGFVESLPLFVLISRFSCYKSREINHFFCDIVPIMKLTCSDTSLSNLLIFICGTFLSIFPFLFTFIPYIFIIQTILSIRSGAGKHKAFYTCSSHLTVVILLYVTLICQYLRPTSMDTLESSKLFSLFNTAAVPMLNPLIYSLKNKDVKSALKRWWFQLTTCSVRGKHSEVDNRYSKSKALQFQERVPCKSCAETAALQAE
ncbi:olfactory receptor 8D1-like [Pseudophryne corroboree]|uniref:olfactory receptor 8D1-like n=1 Tax=Pseudophryne corroboree TaxID=495146 RepID=UPI0030814251